MIKRIIFLELVLIIIQFCPSLAWTQDQPNFAVLFKQGTDFYVQKKFENARDAFTKALQQDPQNATALANLGLTQFQLGNKALAVGILRNALKADPNLQTAKLGLQFAISKLDVKEIPHEIETYESFRERFLTPVALTTLLGMTALFLLVSGWSVLSYLDRRRQATLSEKSMPPAPVMGILFSFFFLLSVALVGIKIYDSSIPRATIIKDKVALQTAPGDNQAAVLDLYGGMEVIVVSVVKEWTQVTYPGAGTGWVKSENLIR